MLPRIYIKLLCVILISLNIVASTSCNTVNQLRYFKDLPDSAVVSLPKYDQRMRIIQKGDRLQITIGAKNPEAAEIFNRYGSESTSGGTMGNAGGGQGNPDLLGYWVDEFGEVEFPIIGKVKAEGFTVTQLKDSLTALVTPYLRDPLVNVRFINFKFTVLGEVRSPGAFVLSQQRTTLLDALAAAGDLPRSARRYGIQLYRDYNGERKIYKLDLRKSELLNNPELFQVMHNDVIIVQPRDMRLFSDEARTYISFFSLLVGTATLIIGVSTIANNK